MCKYSLIEQLFKSSSFPNFKFSTLTGVSNSVRLEPYFQSEIFKASPLEYKGKWRFLHFTSVQTLLNIFKTRAVRLYDLNHMLDPMEFVFGERLFTEKEIKILTDIYKAQLFSFSFLEYEEEVLNESLDLWRAYGLNGKGVCIDFSIDKDNMSEWEIGWTLGKIAYKKLDKENELSELKNKCDQLQEQGINITNLSEVLMPILSYYKSEIYSTEKEVRLIKHIKHEDKDRGLPEGVYPDIKGVDQLTYYATLPLFSKKDVDRMSSRERNIYEMQPNIRINKIYTGYDVADWLNVSYIFSYLSSENAELIKQAPICKYF